MCKMLILVPSTPPAPFCEWERSLSRHTSFLQRHHGGSWAVLDCGHLDFVRPTCRRGGWRGRPPASPDWNRQRCRRGNCRLPRSCDCSAVLAQGGRKFQWMGVAQRRGGTGRIRKVRFIDAGHCHHRCPRKQRRSCSPAAASRGRAPTGYRPISADVAAP